MKKIKLKEKLPKKEKVVKKTQKPKEERKLRTIGQQIDKGIQALEQREESEEIDRVEIKHILSL